MCPTAEPTPNPGRIPPGIPRPGQREVDFSGRIVVYFLQPGRRLRRQSDGTSPCHALADSSAVTRAPRCHATSSRSPTRFPDAPQLLSSPAHVRAGADGLFGRSGARSCRHGHDARDRGRRPHRAPADDSQAREPATSIPARQPATAPSRRDRRPRAPRGAQRVRERTRTRTELDRRAAVVAPTVVERQPAMRCPGSEQAVRASIP